jgi:hypothetical protein
MNGPKGRFFVSAMSRRKERSMLGRSLAVWFLSVSLSACAAVGPVEGPIEQAFREREAAYARLEKAVSSFCSAKHASTEARHECMFENRTALLRLRQLYDERVDSRVLGDALPPGDSRDPAAPSVKCERAGTEMLCRQTGRNPLNYLGG